MRLPPSLVADILLSDPWQHTPPVLADIARGNAVLTANVFLEARMAVFADPRLVEMKRRARANERQEADEPRPSVKERVLREWNAIPAPQREAFQQLNDLLPRHTEANTLEATPKVFNLMRAFVREATRTAYGQRLFFSQAMLQQQKCFHLSGISKLEDASLAQPMLEAQWILPLSLVSFDLLNEVGTFNRSLRDRDNMHPRDKLFHEVVRRVCKMDSPYQSKAVWECGLALPESEARKARPFTAGMESARPARAAVPD